MKTMKSGLVSNVWNQIQMFCLNHEEPEGLELVSGSEDMKEPYYICPHDGCNQHHYMQRITVRDFESINEKVENAMLNMGIAFDMTNYSFIVPRKEPARELRIKVIKASGRHIKLGIR